MNVNIYHPTAGESKVPIESLKVWTKRGWTTEQNSTNQPEQTIEPGPEKITEDDIEGV